MPVCTPNIKIKNYDFAKQKVTKDLRRKFRLKDQAYSVSLEDQMRLAIQEVRDGKTTPVDDFLRTL